MNKSKIIIFAVVITITVAVIGAAFFIKNQRDKNETDKPVQEETEPGEFKDPHMLPEWDLVED